MLIVYKKAREQKVKPVSPTGNKMAQTFATHSPPGGGSGTPSTPAQTPLQQCEDPVTGGTQRTEPAAREQTFWWLPAFPSSQKAVENRLWPKTPGTCV